MSLTLACGDYDRVRALRDGRVRADGIDLTFLPLGPEEIFFRQLVHQEFDVSEMSLGSYVAGLSRGETPFIAIPVFPSRAFRHSSIFVHVGAGIDRPEDLRSKRVGLAEYQLTANIWVRGMLDDDHGVRPNTIDWFTGGLEQPGRREKTAFAPPPGLRIGSIPKDETLSGMLLRGDLDAVITPRMPVPFRDGAAAVRRLYVDHRRDEIDYFRRTRIFPIMHTVVIRKDLYERQRWIAQSLTKAFVEAKRLCTETIYQDAALPYMLPWMNAEIETVRELMGADWWTYGLAPNRHVLETFLRYAAVQGVASRELTPEELFAPETLDTVRI